MCFLMTTCSATGACTAARARATVFRSTRQLAAKFPYSPKQLPIARLEDGGMWDW